MTVRIINADVIDGLRQLPDESVHCVVTSPPYWGLRDYGVAGQIGLEKTPAEFVSRMVEVFREVRRVLRSDGVCFVNLGDSYSGGKTGRDDEDETSLRRRFAAYGTGRPKAGRKGANGQARAVTEGLKPKDLCGIPWRVAFALQDDGWCLRQEIIWSKPNPMPESVTDRCTKAHEQIFLFSKAKWTGDRHARRMPSGDARFLACLIETEGNIAIRRYTHKRETPQHALQIAVANSDRSILEAAQAIAGCGNILERPGCNRPVFYLQWTTKDAERLLWEVYPFMFGKKRQAAIGLMLESRRSNTNKGLRDDIFEKDGRSYYLRPQEIELREKMWQACKALNQHEPVDLSWLEEPKEGRWVPERYWWDRESMKEPDSGKAQGNKDGFAGYNKDRVENSPLTGGLNPNNWNVGDGRNKRSVWTIATNPFPEAHFATFPPELPEICIKAGCPKGGTVLDPFGGAGTTGLVADRLQRHAILIELNPEYAAMADARINRDRGGLLNVMEAAE